ncbi:MAG: hypothetical protein HQK53_06125 [Oligoflexia bacterium]|nr:hypothetical protein [Oligoflexia bacterium]
MKKKKKMMITMMITKAIKSRGMAILVLFLICHGQVWAKFSENNSGLRLRDELKYLQTEWTEESADGADGADGTDVTQAAELTDLTDQTDQVELRAAAVRTVKVKKRSRAARAPAPLMHTARPTHIAAANIAVRIDDDRALEQADLDKLEQEIREQISLSP